MAIILTNIKYESRVWVRYYLIDSQQQKFWWVDFNPNGRS